MRTLIINPTIDRDLELYHLGASAIASFVNAVGRHRAEVVDFTFYWDEWESYLRQRLDRLKPQVVGICTVTPRMPSILRIARVIKAHRPDIKVVLGGHHASLDTEGTCRQPEVDYAIVGEGEYVFHELLDALEDGGGSERLRRIPSLAFRDGEEIVQNPLGMLPNGPQLDGIPFNDWTLWEQLDQMIEYGGFVPIIGIRGCPYKCSFCSSPTLAKRLEGTGPFVRKRGARLAAQEAAYQWDRHRRHGLRYLMFYDQNFLMNDNWLEEFVDEYRSLGMHEKLPFSVYSRVDHVTEKKLELAKSAGCIQLRLGIESGDPYVRNDLLQKELDQDILIEKLELIRKSGMKSLGYFLIGSPGETAEQAKKSFELAREAQIDRAAFFYFTPLFDLQVMQKAGMKVDYLTRKSSATFYQGGELTEQASPIGKLELKWLFYQANGYYLARTALRQVTLQGPRWLTDFPKFLFKAKKDGLDFKLALTQYVYYHGDSYRS